MFVNWEELDLLEFENEEEAIEFFNEVLGSVENVEDFLGIEFAYVDGTYKSDGVPKDKDENEWEIQDVDFSKYRPLTNPENVMLPKKYPAKMYFTSLLLDGGNKNIFYKFVI